MSQETPPPDREPEPRSTPPGADETPSDQSRAGGETQSDRPAGAPGEGQAGGSAGRGEPEPGQSGVSGEGQSGSTTGAGAAESGRSAEAGETRSGQSGQSAGEGDSAESESGRRRIEENIKSKSTWLRLFFIVFFVILYGVAEFVLTVVVVIQFLWVLVNGARNDKVGALGQSLALYNYQIVRYLTFNSDQRPFPIDLDWPPGAPREDLP